MKSVIKQSTIVIPNYNGMKYIENCIESIYKNIPCDVVIVDNASKDGSLEWIKANYSDRVTLICNEENNGFCGAVNQGIKISNTKYVILLNNDTEVDENFVAELEKIMDENPKLFSASAKMINLHDKSKIDDAGDYYCALGWAFAKGKGKNPESFNNDKKIFASCGGAAIYRKEVFDIIGLFDENHFAYLEDIDIGYRARIYGFENMLCNKAVVYHAGSAASGSRYNVFKTKLASRNSIYLIHKNMPLVQWIINLPFLIVGYFVKTLFFLKKGMGKEYIQGVFNGLKMSFSKEGRKHKVRFKIKNMKNYLIIQLELWRNLFYVI